MREWRFGNHSYRHAHVNQLTYEQNIEDMQTCNEKIRQLTQDEVRFYRGPYGEYNNTVITAAKACGMRVIQWDVDTLDYEGLTPDQMCERIRKKIRKGSILLMHNDTKYTAEGLQQIIDTIKEEGYEIIPLERLVDWDSDVINSEGRQIPQTKSAQKGEEGERL